MIYELWDTESRNVIGEFDTREAAYAAIREAVAQGGAEAVAQWSLLACDAAGAVHGIASSYELVRLAEQVHSRWSTIKRRRNEAEAQSLAERQALAGETEAPEAEA